jgi:protein CpxP
MRNRFCTLALTGLLALGTAGSVAIAQDTPAPPPQQGGGHRGMDPDAQLKHMTKELDLTADQQAQIKPILESQQQQMMALHQDQSLSREDRMGKMKAIHEDSRTKIEAALNDTQKQKFQELQAKQQERMHDRMQGGGQEAAPQQ